MSEPEAPFVLLPYQQRWVGDDAAVKVAEKSRRVGLTWAEASDDVLIAGMRADAGGADVWYIGYNQDMAREFIETCAAWAAQLRRATTAMTAPGDAEEVLVDDDDKDILAFRIRFASGFKITALSSRPSNLRGKQGVVVIDEAAFHPDLNALLKAAFALLIWGGRVRVISTHDGVENPFNELIEDIRAGRKEYSLHRITFDQALSDGLYQRICRVNGETWTQAKEDAWRQEIRAIYGDGASEELDVIPRASGGKWLPRAVIEARMTERASVVRWSCEDGFVDRPDHVRRADCRDWLDAELRPILDRLTAYDATYIGEDFGRTGDLTVLWPFVVDQHLNRRAPFVVELRNVPFTQQEQVVQYLIDRLPRFSGGAFDARGNGAYLAERARQLYGASMIHEVQLSEAWYRENMAPVKAAFEDGTIAIPKDADILEDFRAVEVVKGVPKVPDTARTRGRTGQRHGDAAIACALAYAATRAETGPAEVQVAGDRRAGAAPGVLGEDHPMGFDAGDDLPLPGAGDFEEFMA